MRNRLYGFGRTQLFVIALCIVGAVILLAAALMEPKNPIEEQWLPLNGDVASALNMMVDAEVGNKDEGKNAALDVGEKDEGVNTGLDIGNGNETENEGIGADAAADETVEEQSKDPHQQEESESDGMLDINRASVAELMGLKGIGPSKAQAIVEDRESNGFFQKVDDLLRVKGIGEKLLAGIKESVVARP